MGVEMTITSKKTIFWIIITAAFLMIVGAVIGVSIWGSLNDNEEHVAGGEFSHLYYNTGEILSIDPSSKTFLMAVDDEGSQYIPGDTVEVYYSGLAVFDEGSVSDLAVGKEVRVGYLRPITEYPLKVMVISVL